MGIIKEKKPMRFVWPALFVVVGVGACVGLYRARAEQVDQKIAEAGPRVTSVAHVRPPIRAESGDWKPAVSRLRLPSSYLVDMTDDGTFLLLLDFDIWQSTPRSFELISKAGSRKIENVPIQSNLALTPTGTVTSFPASRQGYWNQRFETRLWTAIDATSMRRTRRDGSKIDVTSDGVVLQKDGRSKTIYTYSIVKRAPGPGLNSSLSVVEHGDDDSVWVYEYSDAAAKLVRIRNSKTTEYPLPYKRALVLSIAQTGESIIGTFSSIPELEPARAYRFEGKKWKELPIPDGYAFSQVQKVTYDGLAIGWVRNLGMKSVPAVWNGNQCVLLERTEQWPRLPNGTQIVAAARNGNVYVQPNYERLTNSHNPTTELGRNSYVLNIRK